jgi:UDP-glucuronate 4-epimerase
MKQKILITGAAGFIGYHLANKLKHKFNIVGLDSFNHYYEPDLKRDRAKILKTNGITIHHNDIVNGGALHHLLKKEKPDMIVHLAAYAGVRHSINDPNLYIQNNIVGTQNVINSCQALGINKVVYASTSCVMAGNQIPWVETDKTGHQLNPYGYTKAANESQFMSSKIPNTIGLRFFTVYGPWGRPDMALFDFTKKIIEGSPIKLFNYGDMIRDFTYIDDIIQGLELIVNENLKDDPIKEIFNIGYGEKVPLFNFVEAIEENLGRRADKLLVEMHPADTHTTWSDTTKIQKLGYKPTTSYDVGVKKFVSWYKNYYNVN